ncbi:MAG: DNA mismatch repair endonuclease MutL [Lachnospiraceae bacterium]|nr:DNA mismatch repair endonuclease MutL [Lachnospiraceae bacterium]
MGNIRLLDKETINKIAAGEVVDRPFSVVKELVENSIDSGATQITCEIKDGGKSIIRISDNGSGFNPDDIKIAFLRHSTSKIKNEEDLDKIKSLGFRGEALSSISAVAKVELLTKRAEDFLGARYVIEGGEEKSFEEAGCPDGTTLIIRDLFYNVPARRKFLKSNMTETGYIGDCLNRLAVSHPEIAFRFISGGKTILFTNGNGSEKDALYSIYGRDIVSNLIKISYENDAFKMEGYIGKPVILRGNRICENYYINGRYSKSPIITKSIEEAYRGYTMHYKYPFTSLHFEFPLDKLDVNVHPSKMEVRLYDGDYYYGEIVRVLSDAIHKANLIVDSTLEAKDINADAQSSNQVLQHMPQSFESVRLSEFKKEVTPPIAVNTAEPAVNIDYFGEKKILNIAESSKEVSKVSESAVNTGFDTAAGTVFPEPDSYRQVSILDKEEFMNDKELTKFRIIGQLFKTYWIIEMDNSMFMIDQHAAHEKVLYERFMKKYKENKVCSQQLFPSLIVSLSMSEKNILDDNWMHFKDAGFEIEPFGDREYQITAVPAELYNFSGEDYFKDVLDDLAESPTKRVLKHVDHRIATMACKAAVKGNEKISETEAEALIKELLTLENPYHCPHGRPTIITISKSEIEKKFKRII